MCLPLGKYGTEQKLPLLSETESDIVTISLERVVAKCLRGRLWILDSEIYRWRPLACLNHFV